MAAPRLITVEEFVKMETADTEAYELVDGILAPLSSPLPIHCVIKDRLIKLVGLYFDQNPIGGAISETDCRISRYTVRRPDYAIFVAEKWQKLELRTIPIPFAPDIAIEILSPSEHVQSFKRKVRDYISAGSREVWIIDTESRDIEIRTKFEVRLLEADSALETPLLPGFSVSVESLLA